MCKYGLPVKSEALNVEVSPEEPILVKLEYEEEQGKQKMEIDIKLIANAEPQPVKP